MAAPTYSRTNFYFTMLLVNLMSIGTGCTYSWTSPALPYLMSADSILPIDQSAASWIASVYLFGGGVGPLFACRITQSIGYKKTFILCNIMMLLSWMALASTWSVHMLYFGRFLSGFTVGMIYLTFPLYVAEVSEDSIRSAMNSLLLVFRCFGIFLEFALGPYLSYHQLITTNAVSMLLYLVFSPRMPESPYYLIAKGKMEEAVKTVAWLRGSIPLCSAEIITNQIKSSLERNESHKKSMKDLLTRGNMKGLLITGTLLALQQLTGVTVMLFYAQQLFSFDGGDVSAEKAAIVYGTVYFAGSGFGPILAKKYGFRKPLIISGIVIFIAHFVLGLYLICYTHGFDVSSVTWCPILCTLVYAATFNCALGPMPWAIMGEIFPPNVKRPAAAIVTTVCFLFAFCSAKLFPILSAMVHTSCVFWMFATASIMVSVFTAIFVPNTKGLSLDQIQEKINKNKNSKHTHACVISICSSNSNI